MPLTDTAIRSAKPKAKTFRLFDTGGLYLEVSPAGGKWWRWKYRFAGKEKRLSFGVYPDVSLRAAREKRDASRKQHASGLDPGESRKAEKFALAGAENFEAIVREWHTEFFSPKDGARNTATESFADSKTTYFRGSVDGLLPKSNLQNCSRCYAGLRVEVLLKLPIERGTTAIRCIVMQWQQAVRNAIPPPNFVGRWNRRK